MIDKRGKDNVDCKKNTTKSWWDLIKWDEWEEKEQNTLTLNWLIRISDRKIVQKRSKRITPTHSFKKCTFFFFLLERCAVGCCVLNNCVVRLERKRIWPTQEMVKWIEKRGYETYRCYKESALGLRTVGPLASRPLIRSLIFCNIAVLLVLRTSALMPSGNAMSFHPNLHHQSYASIIIPYRTELAKLIHWNFWLDVLPWDDSEKGRNND